MCRITCAWRKLPNFGSRKVSWRSFRSNRFASLESLVTLKLQWSQSCQAVFRNTGERFGSPADSGEPALVCSLVLHSCPTKVAVFGLIFWSEGLRTLCRASGWDRAQASRNCECTSLAGAMLCFPAGLRQFTDLKDTESAAALFEACNLAADVLLLPAVLPVVLCSKVLEVLMVNAVLSLMDGQWALPGSPTALGPEIASTFALTSSFRVLPEMKMAQASTRGSLVRSYVVYSK